MKLRIVSDGTGWGTRIESASTGERVENVLSVTWTVEGSSAARATVELWMPEADVVGATAEPKRGEPLNCETVEAGQ